MSMQIRAIWLNVSIPIIVWQRRVPRAPADLVFVSSINVLGASRANFAAWIHAAPARELGSLAALRYRPRAVTLVQLFGTLAGYGFNTESEKRSQCPSSCISIRWRRTATRC